MKIMIETEISTDNGAFYKKYSIAEDKDINIKVLLHPNHKTDKMKLNISVDIYNVKIFELETEEMDINNAPVRFPVTAKHLMEAMEPDYIPNRLSSLFSKDYCCSVKELSEKVLKVFNTSGDGYPNLHMKEIYRLQS